MSGRAAAGRLVLSALVFLLGGPVPALAQPGANGTWLGEPAGRPPAELPLNGVWHYSQTKFQTQGPDGTYSWMSIPNQATLWEVAADGPWVLEITDCWVTGDQFEVYVNGTLELTTPSVPEYVQPEFEPDVPGSAVPFDLQDVVEACFHDDKYSHGSRDFEIDQSVINVRSVKYPDGLGGAGFAIRAFPQLPTPTRDSTWGRVKALYR